MFVKADICDRDAVNKLFDEEEPDIVVNSVAESHADRSGEYQNYYENMYGNR